MKKLILATMLAVAGWLTSQAQSMPAPERYNEFIEQIAAQEPTTANFMMNATMESLADNPKGYRQMMELAEKRFSDPADPIHNESLYMVVLNHAVDKFVLSNAEKEKQRLLLEGAKKNMIGSIATDFDYVTPNDKTVHHLKDLKADYILVYFNNPDCESCEAVKQRLESNELINKLVNEKKLIVLAIYPYDDQKLWKKAKYPKMMINGWNQSRNIEYGELYDLPTLPCFYLMNKDFRVLVKNEGSLNKVEAALQSLLSQTTAGPAPEASAATPSKPAAKPATKQARVPVPADDPKLARCEQILDMLLNNKSQEIYDNLSEVVKEKVNPTTFEGAISQLEAKLGKYQGHEAWNTQTLRDMKAYTSLVNFEKSQIGLALFFDPGSDKVLGINLLPAQAIKGGN